MDKNNKDYSAAKFLSGFHGLFSFILVVQPLSRHRQLSWSLLILITYTMSSCQSHMDLGQLHKAINQAFAGQQGHFVVAFKDLSTGATFAVNEHEPFHAATP